MEKQNFFREFFDLKTDKAAGKVGFWNALGVGSWDVFNSGSGGFIGAWLLYFLTTFGGIDPVFASVIISLRLVVDMVWAPAVANISDGLYKYAFGRKYGRRRSFLIFCIPASLFFILMWVPLTGGLNWLYYLTIFILFDFFIDLILIPWETLPAEMTEDFTQRNKMGTLRMWGAGLAQPVVALVPAFFMSILPAPEGLNASPWALFATAVCWGVMGIGFTYFVWASSWEQIDVSEEKRQQILDNLSSQAEKKFETLPQIIMRNVKNLWMTLRIKTFRKHLALYFSTFGVIDSYTSIFVIFCSIAFLPVTTVDPKASGVILGVPLLIMSFGFAPFGAWLLNHPKIGPQKLYTFGFGLGLIAIALYGFTYYGRSSFDGTSIWWLVVLAHCIFTVGRQFIGGVPWVVYPMMADIDEVITRDKRAGVFAGAMTFVRKATQISFQMFIGIVLGIAGYNQDVSLAADKVAKFMTDNEGANVAENFTSIVSPEIATQISSAGSGVAFIMVFFVGMLFLFAFYNAITFKLNSYTHQVLIYEIERLRKVDVNDYEAIVAAKKAVLPEVRAIVEDLTGLDYDKFVWSGDLENGDPKVQIPV